MTGHSCGKMPLFISFCVMDKRTQDDFQYKSYDISCLAETAMKKIPIYKVFPVSSLPLKGCHSFQYPLEGCKKQEIVGNTFRMFGLGS